MGLTFPTPRLKASGLRALNSRNVGSFLGHPRLSSGLKTELLSTAARIADLVSLTIEVSRTVGSFEYVPFLNNSMTCCKAQRWIQVRLLNYQCLPQH